MCSYAETGALPHRAGLVFEIVQTRIALLQAILRNFASPGWADYRSGIVRDTAYRYQEVFTPNALGDGPCAAMSGSVIGDECLFCPAFCALTRLMRDISLQVRNSAGGIVQLSYGEDNLDPVAMEDAGGKPINLPRSLSVVHASLPHQARIPENAADEGAADPPR